MNATEEQVDFPTLIKAIEGHYKNNDGSAVNGLPEIFALEAFKEAYNKATKTANGNATSAKAAALYDMASNVRETATSIDVHIVNPRDTQIVGRGRDKKVLSDENGEPIYGVSVIQEDGHLRFLRNVDEKVARTLTPGQAAQLKGEISVTKNLLTGYASMRVGKETTLTPGGHEKEFPRIGLDFHVGEKTKAGADDKLGGWGPWALDTRTNTIRGTFHARFATDKPVYATLNLDGCAFINESRGEVAAFFNTDDGFKGVVMLPQVWINDNFGLPTGTDRDGYADGLREKAIFVHVTNGTIFRRLSMSALGGEASLEAAIEELNAQDLMTKPDAKDRQWLKIPKAAAEAQMREGDFPHVEIGDQKVYAIERKGSWVDVYTLPDELGLTIECVEQTLKTNAGGVWTKNEGGFAVPIGDVKGGTAINASKFDESNPLYAALMAFDMSSEADEEAPEEPKPTFNLTTGA